jgi:hypothetical protein
MTITEIRSRRIAEEIPAIMPAAKANKNRTWLSTVEYGHVTPTEEDLERLRICLRATHSGQISDPRRGGRCRLAGGEYPGRRRRMSAHQNSAAEITSTVPISAVYTAITGITPRRTGRYTWRTNRPGGDSPDRISGDDSRGIWHDFVDDSGGGVLDLIVQFRGVARDGLAGSNSTRGGPFRAGRL